MADLDVLKDIPGYKAILKSVLKSQIQLLLEQLSDHTGEESIILTASVHDGTLSHLGSWTGKGFLDGREEIKSQFLGYCLKSHHRASSKESRGSPYERPQSIPRQPMIKRPRTSNYGEPQSDITQTSSQSGYNFNNSINSGSSTNAFQSDLNTSTPESAIPSASTDFHHNESSMSHTDRNTSETFSEFDSSKIKVEAADDNEELEITGVEVGQTMPGPSDSWAQGVGTSTAQGTELNTGADLTDYRRPGQQDHRESVWFDDVEVDLFNLWSIENVAVTRDQPASYLLNKVVDLIFTKEELGSSKGTRNLNLMKVKALEDYVLPDHNNMDDNEDAVVKRIKMSRTPIYKPLSKSSRFKGYNLVQNNNYLSSKFSMEYKRDTNHGSWKHDQSGDSLHDHIDEFERKQQNLKLGLGDYDFISDTRDKASFTKQQLSRSATTEGFSLNRNQHEKVVNNNMGETDTDRSSRNMNQGLGEYGFISDTPNKRFGCVICRKCFTHKGDLKRHIRIHTGERPYECRVCGRTFNQSTHLRLHQVKHMKEEPGFEEGNNMLASPFMPRESDPTHMRVETGFEEETIGLSNPNNPRESDPIKDISKHEYV